jgi:allantoate deiminase
VGTAAATATAAAEAVRRCRALAACSEEPGATTRTFLSAPIRDVHAQVTQWMRTAGMTVTVDHAGNIRGVYPGAAPAAPRLFVGSHLDTVPHAGAFDGVLGVMLGIALVESLGGRRLPFAIEVIGFSEEEGGRFRTPFIGSRALAGCVDEVLLSRQDANGHTVADAIRAFGLDPARLGEAAADPRALGYLEFHIEQGPVLDRRRLPLAIVDAIAGQSRLMLTFSGAANHAGTTPMPMRRDALAGAAEWIAAVESAAATIDGLAATVGHVEATPNVVNMIVGRCEVSLDVRHKEDRVRVRAYEDLLRLAGEIAARRGLVLVYEHHLDQPATPMDAALTALLTRAVESSGAPLAHLTSGAGHDAMIVARRMPVAMLFMRSPGGVSHHPDETVAEPDVAAALAAGMRFLDLLAAEGA